MQMQPAYAGIGSLAYPQGMDQDSMLVHMTPREVGGLQALARAHGATEEDLYDPVTGQPRFGFLKNLLPMIAGAILGPGGAGIFQSSLTAAAAVGLGYGLIEGDLKKGLMAGLGAYSGSNIASGLKAAAAAPAQAAATAPPPTPALQGTDYKFSTDAVNQNLPLSAMRQTPVSSLTGQPMISGAGAIPTVTQAPPLPTPAATPPPAPSGFNQYLQGAQNALTTKGGADAFMGAMGGGFESPFAQTLSRAATTVGALNALTPDQQIPTAGSTEETMYIPGPLNPKYGTGGMEPLYLPGRYYKKTAKGLVPFNPFQKAPGYAAGGMVAPSDQYMNQPRQLPNQNQNMQYPMQPRQIPDQSRVMPYPNQNYPLSTVVQSNYASQPINRPQAQEVVDGYEPKINPFTGEEKFADGGAVNENDLVAANKAYVEDLNRRAKNPMSTPYGMVLDANRPTGTFTPGTYTGGTPYGDWQAGTTGATGQAGVDPVTGLLAAYGAQKAFTAAMPYAQTALAKFGIGTAGSAGAAGAGAGTFGGTAATSTVPAGAGTFGGTYGAGAGAGTSGIGSTLSNVGSNVMKAAPYLAAALGAQQTYQGISQGKEGKAAANAAATAALLGGGPITAAAAAAVAAIGASLVQDKEMGDVALRNYWRGVDQGRGLGTAPAAELAQGFINFYRTNKNEFAGQAAYGRKGNEDFLYDMTQVINNAVKDGKIKEGATAEQIYASTVQPWLNSMGSGPQDDKARVVQDFMMKDLIYNFMQGNPISNAQVKGDKNYKIVSQKPVYAGTLPKSMQAPAPAAEGTQQGIPTPPSPYGDQTFADGGAIGDDYNFGFAGGGDTEYLAGGKLLDGPGDGMSDDIPAVIRGRSTQRAALADGEFVIPADVVSHLGNGSTKAGAKRLYKMMDQVRRARTGRSRQAPAVKAERFLPA